MSENRETDRGGSIPIEEITAYRTHCDKTERTNAGWLTANYPVKSEIREEAFPPHNGFVTANIDVVYVLNGIEVMNRHCQIIMRPDKSEATIKNTEHFFAAQDLGRHNFEMATITREQFNVTKETVRCVNLTGQKPHVKGVKRRRPKSQEEREDEEFLAWLRKQPSALGGGPPCDPCHVRRAGNSGVGMKPRFSALPLTREQHNRQHQHGEREMLEYYTGVRVTALAAKNWFERTAAEYFEDWKRETGRL